MVDQKGLILAIAAVFVALGLGILVGVSVLGADQVLVERQTQLIRSLEDRFEEMQAANRAVTERVQTLEAEMEETQRRSQQLAQLAVAGRLQGQTVAVVRAGEGPVPTALTETLQAAGADLRKLTVAQAETLAARDIARRLWVVVITEPRGSVESDGELLRRLQAASVPPVVVQSDVGPEAVYRYDGDYSSVEMIDVPAGQVALIWALSGAPGRYGADTRAAGFLPEAEGP